MWPAAFGIAADEDRRIEHEHGAGDAGHAAGHDDEHFAARELRQIRPDEQRRLDLADENIGRRGQPGGAADVERLFQRPGKTAHDRRHDAPVEQQRRQHAHHQHHRQRLEAEDELRRRRLDVERRGAAADIAEHESGAGLGRVGDRIDRAIDPIERDLGLRHFEHQQSEREGDAKPGHHRPPRHRAAVLADRKGERENGEHAQRRLQVEHCGCGPDSPGRL